MIAWLAALTALSAPASGAGSLVTWGDPAAGGDASAVEPLLRSGVVSVQTADRAMAALKEDGSVVAWGDPTAGGAPGAAAPSLAAGVVKLYSCPTAFAALKTGGAVVSWGDAAGNSSAVSAPLASGVTQVVPNSYAFAALKSDGSVVTWGYGGYGGNSSSVAAALTSGVTKVVAMERGFAALKSNGSVVFWGSSNASLAFGTPTAELATALASGVTDIVGNPLQFAAIKSDGSVVMFGGLWPGSMPTELATKLSSGVQSVIASPAAMTAFKAGGETVCWDSRNRVLGTSPTLAGPVAKFAVSEAKFVAVMTDGSAVKWGVNTTSWTEPPLGSLDSGVADVVGAQASFRAVKTDGTLVTWGSSSTTPQPPPTPVKAVFPSKWAWAMLATDGSVTAEGDPAFGGNLYGASRELASGPVSTVFAGGAAFAALIETPRVFVDSKDFLENLPPSSEAHVLSVPMGQPGETFSFSLVAGAGDGGNPLFSINGPLLKPLAPLDHETTPVASVRVHATGDQGTAAETVLHLRVLNDHADDPAQPTYGAVAFGNVFEGGDASAVESHLRHGVVSVHPSSKAFSALKRDGSVVVWGRADAAGDENTVPVDELSNGVGKMISGYREFVGLTPFGSVARWGPDPMWLDLNHGIEEIVGNAMHHVALAESGQVLCWGVPTTGVDAALAAGCTQVLPAAPLGFVALTKAGEVVSWGTVDYPSANLVPQLRGGVVSIAPLTRGFIATRSDGGKVVWGTNGYDSYVNSLPVGHIVDVVRGSDSTGAILMDDGSVVTGGTLPPATVVAALASGVTSVVTNGYAYAAVKSNGSAIVWGDPATGGNASVVDLSSGVMKVIAGTSCFAALKQDGSVVTWGAAANGGDSSLVAAELAGGVTLVKAVPSGFVAVTSNGRVAIWGGARSRVDFAALDRWVQGRAADVIANDSAFVALVQEPAPAVDWVAEPLAENSRGGSVAGRFWVSGPLPGETYRFSLVAGHGDRDNGFFATDGNTLRALSPLDHETLPLARVRVRLDGSQGSQSEKAILIRIDNDFADDVRSGHRVVTWGLSHAGGSSATVAGSLLSGVAEVVTAKASGFVALKTDGSVLSWGTGFSNVPIPGLNSGAIGVSLSAYGGAAILKQDGSVVPWVDHPTDAPEGSDASALLDGVVEVSSSTNSHAALKRDGSVVSWGGTIDFYEAAAAKRLQGGVVKVFANEDAFAALKWDGSVVVWGSYSGSEFAKEAWKLTEGVVDISATRNAFTALKNDGAAVSWGNHVTTYTAVSASVASGVVTVAANSEAFAALKADGSVVTWGTAANGGDSSAVADRLASGVVRIHPNKFAFAALKVDGSVVTWGKPGNGGSQGTAEPSLTSGVVDIASSLGAFAARKSDGSVVWWGSLANEWSMAGDPAALTSGVVSVVGCENAFAAIKADGTAIAWGQETWGGDASSVASQLKRVSKIVPASSAFAALIPDPAIEPGRLEIVENLLADTVVATLAATGLQAGETATFTLAGGQPVEVTHYFQIHQGNKLCLRAPLDFEHFSAVNVRLHAVGTLGTFIDSSVAVTVADDPADNWSEWLDAAGLLGAQRDPAADPDGDGVVNAIEFAIGSNPDERDGDRPSIRLERDGAGYFVEYFRNRAAAGSQLTLHHGDALSDWKIATDGEDGVSIQTYHEWEPGLDRVTSWFPSTPSGRFFSRLVTTE